MVARLRFENYLTLSQYKLTPSLATGSDGETLDLLEDAATLQIVGGEFTGGVANFPHTFEVVRT